MLEKESINVKISSTVLASDKPSIQASFRSSCHKQGAGAEVNCCRAQAGGGEEACPEEQLGWWVGGGRYDVNVKGSVSLSTQPLSFPAARSCPKAGTLTLANPCGLGQRPDVSGSGQAAGEHWQLNTEHSSPVNTALKVLKTPGVS